MDLEIKDQNIENYTTISVKDYIETILQGFCNQCGKKHSSGTRIRRRFLVP